MTERAVNPSISASLSTMAARTFLGTLRTSKWRGSWHLVRVIVDDGQLHVRGRDTDLTVSSSALRVERVRNGAVMQTWFWIDDLGKAFVPFRPVALRRLLNSP